MVNNLLQILVVPDDSAHNRVPNIVGLMTYQRDTEQLRLRKNDTWRVVAEEEMVKDLAGQVENKMVMAFNANYRM